ncbi:MAG: hypothetical protein QM205_00100 [Bacillota bacterium]|jgi:hypothetical protein|nr:hypothetical protein [Bacillota bacterium]
MGREERKAKLKKFRQDRKLWYRNLKRVLKLKIKRPRFVFFGKQPETKSVVLSNHVGAYGPLTLEIYAQFPLRMWGTHHMNTSFKELWRYQTQIYYHQKKGWNIHLARLFCLLASPLTYMFYKGLRLISTYQDHRFKTTLRESMEVLNNNENIVIFPEDSNQGYLDKMTHFYNGFVMLCEVCFKRNMDLSIYTSYLRQKDNVVLFSAPVLYSELKEKVSSREEIANYLLNQCNALGKVDLKEITDDQFS